MSVLLRLFRRAPVSWQSRTNDRHIRISLPSDGFDGVGQRNAPKSAQIALLPREEQKVHRSERRRQDHCATLRHVENSNQACFGSGSRYWFAVTRGGTRWKYCFDVI